MSAHHLAGFLEDLRFINPEFRASTSSVRPLLQHLRRTVDNPAPLSLDQALGQLRARSDRTGKYRPAIQRLVSVWGQGDHLLYPAPTGTPRLREESIARLCFRGDGRGPDEIFAGGFKKRNLNTQVRYRNDVAETARDINPNVRLTAGMTKAGDIDPFSAVCVSPDLHLAALFPPPHHDTFDATSWLYMVLLRRGYNTSGRQVLDALRGFKQLATHELGGHVAAQAHQDRVHALAMLLYGREMAADEIPATDVILALEVRRKWNHVDLVPNPVPHLPARRKADFWQGGSYRIESFRVNDRARPTIEGPFESAILHFIGSTATAIRAGTDFDMPTPDMGYAASTRT